MASALLQRTKDFFTTDGQITKKGLLTSTALGGFYFGLPLYLGFKKIATLRDALDKTQDAATKFKADFKSHSGSTSDFLKAKAKPLATLKNLGIAGALALGGAAIGVADHYTSFENENANRLSHFGAVGFIGKAVAGAAVDSREGTRPFFTSLGPRLSFKGANVGSAAIDGTIDAAKTTVEFAGKAADVAADATSVFADPDDKEGKAIFGTLPLSKKFVTVCVNTSDYANSVKDQQGKITWQKKSDDAAKKLPDYIKRMDQAAEGFRKDGSDFRKALEKSASGVVINEPGYLHEGNPTVKSGQVCDDKTAKPYKYNAETYLKGTRHTPDGFIPGKQ